MPDTTACFECLICMRRWRERGCQVGRSAEESIKLNNIISDIAFRFVIACILCVPNRPFVTVIEWFSHQ